MKRLYLCVGVKRPKMDLPKKLGVDCLIEAIVEIRIRPLYSLELWGGLAIKELTALGYEYISVPSIDVRLDHEGQVAADAENPQAYTASGLWVKDTLRFVMTKDAITFNCQLGHYLGWERYKQEITRVVKVIKACGIAESFTRVQLRYISEFPNTDILAHIRGRVELSSATGALKCHEVKFHDISDERRMFVYLTNNAKRDDYNASLFDVNIYAHFPPITSVEAVIDCLEKVHALEKETFFSSLEESFVETLQPEY